MTICKVPEARTEILSDFYNKSCLTYEGLELPETKAKKKEFEKHFRDAGFSKEDFVMFVISGKMMNDYFTLTESNSYPEDLNICVIPDFYNVQFKLQTAGRWFDDIVANNNIRQNAINGNHEPDYK